MDTKNLKHQKYIVTYCRICSSSSQEMKKFDYDEYDDYDDSEPQTLKEKVEFVTILLFIFQITNKK